MSDNKSPALPRPVANPRRHFDRGGRIRVRLPTRSKALSTAPETSAEPRLSANSNDRSSVPPLKRRKFESLQDELQDKNEGSIAASSSTSDIQHDDHGATISAIATQGRLEKQRKAPKSYLEKLSILDQGWATKLPELASTYAACHSGDGPQFDATMPAVGACACNTNKRIKDILCVFMTGIKTMTITFCACRSDADTLLRNHLFPSSPVLPRAGFHLKLLEFYSVLRVEGHVSCQAFSYTCSYVHNYSDPDTLRKSLSNAFFAYKEMLDIIQIRLAERHDSLEPEFPCPVCPEDQRIVALDGNFQLRRRKDNDNDTKKPNPTGFFLADGVQDAFERITTRANVSTDDSEKDHACKSVFKAAELTYTSRNYAKFHERGVVGCLCVHNIPLAFTNVYESGEKHKHALAVLDTVRKTYNASNLSVMYDIACRFKKSLQTSFPDMVGGENFGLAIGVFHAYTHSMPCQLKFNPRYLEGWGLINGEGMERLWSYLNGFVSMTRQMSAKRRMITLNDGIHHYKDKHIISLPRVLKQRKARAHRLLAETTEFLNEHAPTLTDEEFKQRWIEYVRRVCREHGDPSIPVPEEQKKALIVVYFTHLELLYINEASVKEKEQELKSLNPNEDTDVEKISDLEEDIKKAKKSIRSANRSLKSYEPVVLEKDELRWPEKSVKYKEARRMKTENDLEQARSMLQALIINRTALKDQLHREGTLGIKLTTKLQKQVQKIKDDAQPYLDKYNEARLSLDGDRSNCKAYVDICNFNNDFWTNAVEIDVRLLHQYSRKQRAKEELKFVEEEEARLKTFVESACQRLESAINNEREEEGYRRILLDRLVKMDIFWSKVNDGRSRSSAFIERPGNRITRPCSGGNESATKDKNEEANEDDLLDECNEQPVSSYEDIENGAEAVDEEDEEA